MIEDRGKKRKTRNGFSGDSNNEIIIEAIKSI